MLRVLPTFLGHRLLLILTIIVAINFDLAPRAGKGKVEAVLPPIQPLPRVWDQFEEKITKGTEVQQVTRYRLKPTWTMISDGAHPFVWVCKWASEWLGLSAIFSVILFSNLFFLLFLSELVALISRMETTDIASAAAILCIVWPNSMHMSLGSSLAFTCYLTTATLRFALDNQWTWSGLAIGLLWLADPVAAGIVPVVVFLFWYFERHLPVVKLWKSICFLLVPLLGAVLLKYLATGGFVVFPQQSALVKLFAGVASTQKGHLSYFQSSVGQFFSILLIVVGSVLAILHNATMVHKLIPPSVGLSLLIFSSYGTIATRAPIGGICFLGAVRSAGPLNRFLQPMLGLWGVYEFFRLFS